MSQRHWKISAGSDDCQITNGWTGAAVTVPDDGWVLGCRPVTRAVGGIVLPAWPQATSLSGETEWLILIVIAIVIAALLEKPPSAGNDPVGYNSY